MNNYQIYGEIGRGPHSVVYKGRKKSTVSYYAIKSVDKAQNKEKILSEVKILYPLRHPNILKFVEWYETTNHIWLVLELCTGGDVLSLLLQDGHLPEFTVRTLGVDILTGLQYVHSQGVLLCDLKPSNILVDGFGILKLADFGFARKFANAKLNAASGQSVKGTPAYMAPELFDAQVYFSTASDFWAFGCLLYELAVGKTPFYSNNFEELASRILDDPVPKLPPGFSDSFQDLLERLLHKNPLARIKWPELLRHPFWSASTAAVPAALDMPEYPFKEEFSKYFTSKFTRASLDKNVMKALRASQVLDMNSNTAIDFGNASAVASSDESSDVPTEDEEFASEQLEDDQPQQRIQSNVAQHQQTSSQQPGSSASLKKSAVLKRPQSAALELDNLQKVAHQPVPESLDRILFGQHDNTVRPIVGNPKIEKPDETDFDPKMLPVQPYSVSELLALSTPDIETFLTKIYRCITGKTNLSEKMNMLTYFQSLCTDSRSANLIVNSSLMHLFVKVLKAFKSSTIRSRLCTIMGLVIRYATFIDSALQDSQILQTLAELCSDHQNKVRRRAMACMGELCFYVIANSQQEDSPDNAASAWAIPKGCHSAMIRCLRPTEDGIVQLYTWKVLENVCTENREFSRLFASDAIVNAAVPFFSGSQSQGTHDLSAAGLELLRATVISTVGRMSRISTDFANAVVVRVGLKRVASLMDDSVVGVQQHAFNIVNAACLSSKGAFWSSQLLQMGFSEHAASLSRLMMHSSPVIRIKAVGHLHVLLLNVSDRSDSKQPIQDVSSLSTIAQKCTLTIEKLASDKKDKKLTEVVDLVVGQLVHRGRQCALQLFKEQMSFTDDQLEQYSVFLCRLAECRLFLERIFDMDMVESLSCFFQSAESVSPAGSALRKVHVAFQVLEQVTKDPEIVVSWKTSILGTLLPALISILSQTAQVHDDVRFFALKKIMDIFQVYLSPSSNVYDAMQPKLTNTRRINELVVRSILPQFERVLEAAEPTPLYGIKFLTLLVEANPAMVSVLVRLQIMPILLSYLDVSHRNHNVHLIRLFVQIVQSEDVDRSLLLKHELPGKVAKSLERAWNNELEDFLDPVLELASTLMYQCSQAIMQQQQQGQAASAAAEYEKFVQLSIEKNKPLKSAVGVFMDILSSHALYDQPISEKAALCIQLAAQIYPSTHSVILEHSKLSIFNDVLRDDLPALSTRGARSRRIVRTLYYTLTYDAKNLSLFRSAACFRNLIDVLQTLAASHDSAMSDIAEQVLKLVR
eukprot:ANDGO_01424.mRNA.1 Serine/threonine-protein kinase RUNKEL